MAGLTIAEKTHWRDRIAARIDRAIERIKAQNPALFDRFQREAHTQALESLGVAATYNELEATKSQAAALVKKRRRVQRAMVAALRGIPVEEVAEALISRYGDGLELPHEVLDAIRKRQAVEQERLLAQDPTGQEVARLMTDRDELLDVVCLATSPAQVRSLWSPVGAVLGEQPSRLEQEALAIEPAKEG
jgi:hypothetical protein